MTLDLAVRRNKDVMLIHMAAMREIAQPVYDMVRSEIGDEAVDALVSVIQ